MQVVSVAARTIRWAITSEGAARGRSERAAMILEVRSERGAIGLGEAAPLPGMSRDTLDDAARAFEALAARVPFEIGDCAAVFDLAREAAVAAPAAQFAIETALIDALARERGIAFATVLREHRRARTSVAPEGGSSTRSDHGHGSVHVHVHDNEDAHVGDHAHVHDNEDAHVGDHAHVHDNEDAHVGDRLAPRGNQDAHVGDRLAPRGNRNAHVGDRGPLHGNEAAHVGDRGPLHSNDAAHVGDCSPLHGNEAAHVGDRGPLHSNDAAHVGDRGVEANVDLGVDAGPSETRTSRVPLAAVVDDPEAARRAFAAGIRCFKIKVGASGDLDRVRDIAAAAPDATLRLDANRSWPRSEVAARLTALAALPIEYIEEPCADAHVLLAAPLSCKVALDESLVTLSAEELDAALRSPRLAAFVLKPTLLGGPSAVLALAERARRAGVAAIASHGLEGPVGTAACAEVALALGGDRPVGLARHAAIAGWRIKVGQLAADHVRTTGAPGLGFEDLDLVGVLGACSTLLDGDRKPDVEGETAP